MEPTSWSPPLRPDQDLPARVHRLQGLHEPVLPGKKFRVALPLPLTKPCASKKYCSSMSLPLTKLYLFYVVQGFVNMLTIVCKVSTGRVLQPKALPTSPAAPQLTHADYLFFKFSTFQPTCSRPSCTCSIAKASPVRRLRSPATPTRQLASLCAHLLACSTPARLFSSSPASPARLLHAYTRHLYLFFPTL